MSVLKRNIVANMLGGAWITILTVVITPLQINLLGMAAFGVIGFITTLQIAFTAFDMGLSSALTRELAADPSPNKRGSLELLRSARTIYWAAALVIGLALTAAAEPIAARWFTSSQLDPALLVQSLRVIALYLALRWPVALYIGVLTGLQRLDVLNVVKTVTASTRLAGGVLVLLQWHSLYAFLWWTALCALIEVVTYGVACRRILHELPLRPGLSWPALRRVWRFSVSMNALAILAVLIVQLDRLVISKLLPLESLGSYSLAYSAAAGVSVIIGAFSSAILPSFASVHGRGTQADLRARYVNACRVTLFVAGLAVWTFVFFGDPILTLWVNPSAADGAALSLALLAFGFWWSAAVSNGYNMAVAAGRPNLALRVTVLTAAPYALVVYLLVHWLGIHGAALAWLLLNVGYAALLLPVVHREILGLPIGPWLLRTLLPFLALPLVSFAPARWAALGIGPGQPAQLLGLAVGLVLYIAVGYALLGAELRASVKTTLLRMRRAARRS